MASIPLPALHLNPPTEQPGALDNYAKLVQLRALAGGQQVQQQQIERGQLENESAQMELQSRKAMQKAYTEAQGDPDKTVQLASKYGADPRTVAAMQNTFLEQKKNTLEYVVKRGAAAKQDADLIQGAHDAVAAAKPEDRPALYQQQMAALPKQLTDPSQLQQMPPQYPGDDAFKFIGAVVKSHTQQVEEAFKQSEQFKNQQQGEHAQAETAKANAEAARVGKVPGVDVPYSPEVFAQKKALKPNLNMMSTGDAKDIADAIENGDQPPTLQGLYRNAAPVRAELARRGVPIAKMETDWKATQRFVSTLNGPQQTRMRQAISTASDSLDKIQSLYDEYHEIVGDAGMKAFNRVGLKAAKQLPGRAGAVATALDAQIADLTSELGNVYMGGNSPTDHSLGLAAKNLSSDWNRETFEEGLKQARANIKIRQNSITHAAPAGTSGESNYFQQPPAAGGSGGGGTDFFSQFGGKPR